MRRTLLRLWREDRGAAAIEYAFVLPALLMFAFGIIDVGRLVWTQVTLDRAVQAAARCASVNSTTCGTDSAIQTYASGQAWGMSVPAASSWTGSRRRAWCSQPTTSRSRASGVWCASRAVASGRDCSDDLQHLAAAVAWRRPVGDASVE